MSMLHATVINAIFVLFSIFLFIEHLKTRDLADKCRSLREDLEETKKMIANQRKKIRNEDSC